MRGLDVSDDVGYGRSTAGRPIFSLIGVTSDRPLGAVSRLGVVVIMIAEPRATANRRPTPVTANLRGATTALRGYSMLRALYHAVLLGPRHAVVRPSATCICSTTPRGS